MKFIFTFFIALLVNIQAFSQNSAWNSNSFKFNRDNAALENMAGATAVSFGGGPVQASGAVSFSGFAFRYGLSSFNNFYISSYGFIKLGAPIVSNIPAQDSIIAPLYNGTSWAAQYKLTGNAPDRKMVIQFTGVMQPSGEPTNFQVWLYERTGKIQFVYEQIRGFYGFPASYNYKIYCGAGIMKKSTIAALKVNANNAPPSVNYAIIPTSFDSIYANTRYTFQPDTIKPVTPSSLSFSNIQAGCLSVDITENSANESVLTLERSDNGTVFSTEKLYYVTAPAGSTTYNYAQTFVQPFWNYTYRAYVSNGFLNSDTVTNSVQTLMPQINGIKKVPGDYPTIKALLQDAACKHLGPNLVIELQSNYDFTAEPKPVSFGNILQNRLIQSIVIRPALNATINWDAFTNTALFYVDSVKHVYLDGRPGGIGTSQGFTITQQNPQAAIIQYTNRADSGGVNYCRLIKKTSTVANLSYAVVLIPKDSAYSFTKKNVDAFALTNNFIAADNNGHTSDLVYINPADSAGCRNFVISGNQFSRFRRSAVHFETGGENLLIANNHFFQPVSFQPESYLPYNAASCISLINIEKATVDNNLFGGASTNWGIGKFKINAFTTNFSFINYENITAGKKFFVTNNKFGNIEYTGNSYSGSKLINIFRADALLDNNRFGTSDSSNSITAAEYFWGVDMFYGTHTVSNNYFGGFQGGYLAGGTVNHSYFLTSSNSDSVAILNNDIGGSNNLSASSSSGVVHGVYLSGAEKSVTIKNNTIRGYTSRTRSVDGINGGVGVNTSISLLKLEIDSNSIHHLQASSSAVAIGYRANSRATNRIANNTIYALKTTGTTLDPNGGGYLGNLYGINYTMYNWGYPYEEYVGEVQIFGNKIHSLEPVRTLSNSIFSLYGINVISPISKTFNNEIRLGIDSKGQPIDTLAAVNGIFITHVDHQTFLSDKHYVEHNSIYFGGKGPTNSALSLQYSYNYVSPKNVATITNNIFNIARVPLAGSNITSAIYENIQSIKSYGAKNIWYSVSIPNTPALLQSFKNTCQCDSSSFVGNPAFINADGDSSNYNLHLAAGSLADSTGTPSVITIIKDGDNVNRNAFSPVDIGCYAATPCGTGNFPEITLIPSDDSLQLCAGGTIVLTANITGGTFQQLQWQRNLIDSIGANAATLTVTQPGSYRVVGKTACGRVASKTVHVVNYVLQKSVTITIPVDSICQGSSATFTATAVNCGSSPAYQWKVNGANVGTNSATYTSATLNNNDSIKVVVTTTVCGNTSTVTSNTIGIKVRPVLTPQISITASTTTICTTSPGPVIFTASATNAGSIPVYQWQVNGVNVGTNSNTYSSATFNNNDQIKCILTTNYMCATTGTVTSNIITMVVTTSSVQPSVNISTTSSTICAGAAVTFTAIPVNGGSTPSYQWKVNGANAGTNSNIFTTTTLTNGSIVSVVLTSSLTCALPATATSNSITILIGNNVAPAVTIATPTTNICVGANITFTATATNGGSAPVYQWKKNNINIPGANNATYTTNALINGDVISVSLTSNAACANPATVNSNNLSITVSIAAPASIVINGNTTVSAGASTIITSAQTNGGNSPSYQWQDSTNTHTWQNISGANASAINYSPTVTGNKIRCVLTGNNPCIANNTATSNALTFTVTPGFTVPTFYPNPAINYLIVDGLTYRNSWESVHIVSMSGARIITIPELTGLTRVVVDVKSLTPGIYMCVLSSRFGYAEYFKFVKL
jgi:hypothetical protein